MRLSLHFSILVSFFLLSVISCRCTKERTFYFTQTSRDYFGNFLPGSYWVYENIEDTTDYDTLFLADRVAELRFSYTERECDGDYYETIEYNLISNRTKDTLKVKMRSTVQGDQYYNRGKFTGMNFSCYFHYDKSDNKFDANSKDTLIFLPSLAIKNKVFSNVVSWTTTAYHPDLHPDPINNYKIARNVGFVSFKLFSDTKNKNVEYWLKHSNLIVK